MMEDRRWKRFYDPGVPESIVYPSITIPEMLDQSAGTWPDRQAFVFKSEAKAFAEVGRQARRLAGALKKIGFRKGERIGLLLFNSPEYVVAYFASLELGLVVTNLNPLLAARELSTLVRRCRVSGLVASEAVSEKAQELYDTESMRSVILARTPQGLAGTVAVAAPDEWLDFNSLVESGSDSDLAGVEVRPSDPAQIQFTGGTTGEPKGAVLTHANLVAAAHTCFYWFNDALPPVESRILLAALPYHHVYGNVVGLGMGVLSGSTQLVLDRFHPESVAALLDRYERISFFPAVPAMIAALLDCPRICGEGLGARLGLVISGGAPLPSSLFERATAQGITVLEGWGMSESTSLGTVQPALGVKKPGSIGIPMSDTDIRLMDLQEWDRPVKDGEPGELTIRSPLIMKGYWDDPDATADQVRGGWLYTGDVAVQDEDGYLFIVDRKKDVIITKGYNVYPGEVEETLRDHPKVLDAAAIGIADDYAGERIRACVVLKSGVTASSKEIIDFCRSRLASFKIPGSVAFLEALPKSSVGKTLRRALRPKGGRPDSGWSEHPNQQGDVVRTDRSNT